MTKEMKTAAACWVHAGVHRHSSGKRHKEAFSLPPAKKISFVREPDTFIPRGRTIEKKMEGGKLLSPQRHNREGEVLLQSNLISESHGL